MRRFLSLRGTSRPNLGPASPEPEKAPTPTPTPTPPSQPTQPAQLSQPRTPQPAILGASPQWFSPPTAIGRNRRRQQVIHEDGPEDDDERSTAPLVSEPAAPPPPPNLKVKRVDYFWSSWSKVWKYRNTSAKVRPDDVLKTVGNGTDDGNDPWQSFCFVVVRKIPQSGQEKEKEEPTFQIVVKSPYLLIALREVIQNIQGVSWTAEPLEVRLLAATFMSN